MEKGLPSSVGVCECKEAGDKWIGDRSQVEFGAMRCKFNEPGESVP